MPKRNLILFDDSAWSGLRPLTWLCPVADLRHGLLKISERWELLLTGQASSLTQGHLTEGFPLAVARDNYFINAAVVPTKPLCEAILALRLNDALVANDELIAARLDDAAVRRISQQDDQDGVELDNLSASEFAGKVSLLRRPFDLFTINAASIERDIKLVCGSRHSAELSASNTVIGDGLVFLEPGVECEASILDTRDGAIYIGRNAQVLPGCMLRGPLAICESSIVKMGAKVYGGTTIGPHCKVGGEVQNAVFQGYSNKGHDGYLGNAVIGKWCNLGADTNSSNLKNNYTGVRVWEYEEDRFVDSELQFCGLIMGDHAKCGINTMFNTGTVVGIGVNVFGAGFPRTFIPDFAWGGASGFSTYRLDKATDTAELVVARRGMQLSESERAALAYVFEQTAPYRSWEK